MLKQHRSNKKIVLGTPTYGIGFNANELYQNFTGCAEVNNDERKYGINGY